METAHHFSPDARASAMVAFAYCLVEVLPQVQLLGGGVTERGFGYEFSASGIPPDFQDRIQESYQKLLKTGGTLRQVDRLRQNAIDWLDHCGQTLRARLITASDAVVVPLVALGEFWEPCDYVVQSHLDRAVLYVREMVATTQRVGGRQISVQRAQMVLLNDRSEAQKFRRRSRDLATHGYDHISLGRAMGLFFPLEELSQTAWIWRERGLLALENIRRWWFSLQQRSGVQILGAHEMAQHFLNRAIDVEVQNHAQNHRKSPSAPLRLGYWESVASSMPPFLREGLLSSSNYWKDLTRVFCPKEGLLVELQTAVQLLELANSLFGLKSVWWWQPLRGSKNRQKEIKEHEFFLKEALKSATLQVISGDETVDREVVRAELKVQCTLGQWWPTGCIQIFSKKKKNNASQVLGTQFPLAMMTYSVFGSLERIVALLLERKDRRWPLWLEGEVIRLIPVTSLGARQATSIQTALTSLRIAANIDACIGAEDRGVQSALAQKVPYFAVVSDGDIDAKTFTVKCGATGAAQQLTPQDFAEHISQQKLSAIEKMTEVSRV